MARRSLTSLHGYLVLIALTTAVSLLPLRMIGWVSDVASIVRLPAYPFTHLGMRARAWLNDGGARAASPTPGDPEFLLSELERYRALANEWRRLAEENALIVAQMQHTQTYALDVEFTPVHADVIARNTQSDGLTFDLNVGSRQQPIYPGTVAVFDAVHLVGRIGAVSQLSSTLVPLTNKSINLIRGDLAPTGTPADESAASVIHVHLKNNAKGSFTAQAPHDAGVALGDYVYVNDPTWARAAQSMIIGTVRSIEPNEDNPVLVDLIITPIHAPDRVPHVMVKVEHEPGGAGPGGGTVGDGSE